MVEGKERIFREKSEEMFMQFGIRSVSMDDIGKQPGECRKKPLYQYFEDKDGELVDGVIEGTYIVKNEEKCLGCRQNATDAIHEIFLTMEHITDELSNMNPMLL